MDFEEEIKSVKVKKLVLEWNSGIVEEWFSCGVVEKKSEKKSEKNMIAPRSIHRELFIVEMKKN